MHARTYTPMDRQMARERQNAPLPPLPSEGSAGDCGRRRRWGKGMRGGLLPRPTLALFICW